MKPITAALILFVLGAAVILMGFGGLPEGRNIFVGYMVLFTPVILLIYWIGGRMEKNKVKTEKEKRVKDIDTASTETALGILKSKYAAGEIDKTEFEEKKKVLLEA